MAIGRLPSPAPAVTRSWPSPVGTDRLPALTGSDVLAVAERDMRGTEQKQFAPRAWYWWSGSVSGFHTESHCPDWILGQKQGPD